MKRSKDRVFPGALPPIWNVPRLRNPNFTGREQMLTDLHAAMNSGQWLQALTGLGGKGKTSLAREYAYRYRADYDLVWWVHADENASLTMDYASLAAAVGLPIMESPDLECCESPAGAEPEMAADPR